jgi:hypothetical protein
MVGISENKKPSVINTDGFYKRKLF